MPYSFRSHPNLFCARSPLRATPRRWLAAAVLYTVFAAVVVAQTNGPVAEHQSATGLGQSAGHATVRPDTSADIWDVYYGFINRRGHRSTERARAGFQPSIFPELAYSLQTGFAVGANANLSFTSADSKQTISTIVTTPQYTQLGQIIIPIVANLWTAGNRYNIVTDWRYYRYSAVNYGLGSSAPAGADDQLHYTYLRLYQSVLRQVAPNLLVGLGYALDYHGNIRETNRTPDLNDDFRQYSTADHTVSSGPTLSVQYITRRNPNNPEGGFYGNVLFRPNLRALGSDANWQALITDVRKYVPFPKHSRNILAFWNVNWLTFGGLAPYLDLPSTGWDTYSNLGRGYVQGRFRGRNLIYAETEYRMPLLRNGLIGCVVFANVQAYNNAGVRTSDGRGFGQLLPGVGVGLRGKVNKRSNLNFALDYGFGIGGSRGVFLNLGEVF